MILSFHDDGTSTSAGLVDRLLDAAPDRADVIDSYVGSPLYRVIPEHEPAIAGLLVLGLWYAIWGRRSNAAFMTAYRRLSPIHRMLAWFLAVSGVIHLALAIAHEPSGYTVAYVLGAVMPIWVLTRLVTGRRWRREGALVLTLLLVGYTSTLVGGEPPDQLGIGTKLVELAAFAIVLSPRTESRRRRLAANASVVAMGIVVALGGWIGAFAAGDGGHHLGETPHPGVLLPAGVDRSATPEEVRAADDLFAATAAALGKYEDIDVAADAGYNVSGLAGIDFHADNPAYDDDGHILDPERPETLVYAVAASGQPVLLGAMFKMDGVGDAGPAVAGPLTVWHAHDHICFTAPFTIAGLTSPYGLCPLGSVTLPITQEMLHVWVLPGVVDRFGDIDEEWLGEYLAKS
jgi:hypothetical protein